MGCCLGSLAIFPVYMGVRCTPHPTGCLTSIFPSGSYVHPVVQQIPFSYFYMPSPAYYISSCTAHSTSETLPNSVLSPFPVQASVTSHVNYSNNCLSGLLLHSNIPMVCPPHSIAAFGESHVYIVTLPKHT